MTELYALLCSVVVTWARFLLTSHLGCCSQKKKTANNPWIQILETLNKIYCFLFSPGVGAGSQGVCSVTWWWLIRASSKDTPSLLASIPSLLSLPHLPPSLSPLLLSFPSSPLSLQPVVQAGSRPAYLSLESGGGCELPHPALLQSSEWSLSSLSPTSDLCLPWWTFLTISTGFPWMGITEGGYNPHPCVVSSRVKAKTSSLVQSAVCTPQDNCEWGPTQNGNYRTECILRVLHLFYFLWQLCLSPVWTL